MYPFSGLFRTAQWLQDGQEFNFVALLHDTKLVAFFTSPNRYALLPLGSLLAAEASC